jgi:hypothetical protein
MSTPSTKIEYTTFICNFELYYEKPNEPTKGLDETIQIYLAI